MIFSSESVKSASNTLSWPRRAASSAASLARFARSAPTMPGVEAAIRSGAGGGPARAGRGGGDPVEVDVRPERDRPRVHLEDLAATVLVGRRDRDAAVE